MILVLIKTCVQHVKACNVAKGICAKQTDNHEISSTTFTTKFNSLS